MKVVKRDGKFVDYERDKIRVAITKANAEVRLKERATDSEIDSIIEYIESLDKKRILVEDIQDIIEEKLMELGHYELAKKYIVYRYTRALVRKQNTTDESILSLMKRNSREPFDTVNASSKILSVQRNLIAGEVSKDLTKRILLPEKITKAHEEGLLYFHKADYFIQPMIDSCVLNLTDLLEHGTVINGRKLESPKSFQVACIQLGQIIASISSCQYGTQLIFLSSLGKYLRKSYEKFHQFYLEHDKISKELLLNLVKDEVEKELKSGIQTLFYQIQTTTTINGQIPSVSFVLDLPKKDPYEKEIASIIEEVLNQNMIESKEPFSSPTLIYALEENNILKGGTYDYLTHLALKNALCSSNIRFYSSKKGKEIFQEKKWEGMFHQGTVTINLPNIAIQSNQEEDKFFELLEERLELCHEALMCRHYSLLGTLSDVSPIHFQFGAITRLSSLEKIDSLLKKGHSFISLGYIGILEMTKLMTGEFHNQEKGKAFAFKVLNYLKKTCERWTEESGIEFVLSDGFTKEEQIGSYFVQLDKEKFGIIKGITDQKSYHYGYHFDCGFDELESEFQTLTFSGTIVFPFKKIEEIEDYVPQLYDQILYIELRKEK